MASLRKVTRSRPAYAWKVAGAKSALPTKVAPLKSAFPEKRQYLKSTSPGNVKPSKLAESEANTCPEKSTATPSFVLAHSFQSSLPDAARSRSLRFATTPPSSPVQRDDGLVRHRRTVTVSLVVIGGSSTVVATIGHCQTLSPATRPPS